MASSEYVGMERSELEDKLVESRKELFNLRFQKATGQLDNTARLGHVKKDVARILTVIRQQELGIAEVGFVPVGASRRAVDRDDEIDDEAAADNEEEEEA